MDDVDPSIKLVREGTKRPARKTWVTPTIEEADASEVTAAKAAGNAELSTFTKAGS